MMPPAWAVLNACSFTRRRHPSKRLADHDDLIAALVDARTEAQRLADGCGDDLASFFFAHAREAGRLGDAAIEAVLLVTVEQAKQQGRPTEIEHPLPILHARVREIARGTLGFDEFRAWFEDRFPVQ